MLKTAHQVFLQRQHQHFKLQRSDRSKQRIARWQVREKRCRMYMIVPCRRPLGRRAGGGLSSDTAAHVVVANHNHLSLP